MQTQLELFPVRFCKSEEWKIIEEFPMYEVSWLGRVRNRHTGRLKNPAAKTGYLYAKLYIWKHKYKHCAVHRLVASAFLPKPPGFDIVNHKDGNKRNNKASNLEWSNYSLNASHAWRLRRFNSGQFNFSRFYEAEKPAVMPSTRAVRPTV